jgi:hypothetical protein
MLKPIWVLYCFKKIKELVAQIDQLVYKLYDLTEEEIKIIAGGVL